MKKKFCATLLAAIILMTSLSACSGNKPNTNNETGTDTSDRPTDTVSGTETDTSDKTETNLPETEETAPDIIDTEPPETEETEPPAQEDIEHPLMGKLVINEICSSNKSCFDDGKGNFYDWLEILNVSDEKIDLSGIGLSKNEDEPYTLKMPKISLTPGAFMVIFCNKNEEAGFRNSNVYAPFNIGADGETIYLSAPQEEDGTGELLDVISVPKLKSDDVYGRSEDGVGTFTILSPTPNKSNRSAKEIKYISAPTFSKESGFYDKKFDLTISAKGGTVYYTTDCSDPTTSQTRKVYRDKIEIDDATNNPNVASAVSDLSIGGKNLPAQGLTDKCTVIRAVAVDKDDFASSVETHVYFVGKTAEEYRDFTVVSVSADHGDLFDGDRGIYVVGNYYRQWLNSPDYVQYNNADKKNPANYNQDGREWEREATFRMFENGKTVYNTDCGVRIAGNWSRQATQKSLRLYARGEYGDTKFSYPFFDGLTGYDGNIIDKFDKLTLSTGGNDWWQTKMTNSVISDAVADTNVDVMATRPCVLFLNGEFWGLYFLSEKQEDEHIESHYGVKAENVTVVKNGSTEGDKEIVTEYKKTMTKLLDADISDPEVYKQFSELIDFDSLIDYVAIETYIINRDWSKETSLNNWMMWRSNTVDPSNPYADGKWRFALFDVDGGAKQNAESNMLTELNNQKKWQSFTAVFYKLCENEEFKNRFYERAKEIITVNFAPERMKTIIDGYATETQKWVEKTYVRFSTGGTYSDKLNKMLRFYETRPAYALSYLEQFCGKK